MSKKKPQPRKLPRSSKAKLEPSVVDQFRAAMTAEDLHEDAEHRRTLVVNAILNKIARSLSSLPGGIGTNINILSIDINKDNILDDHKCIRCSCGTTCIGHICIDSETVCVYPICSKCGKMSSVPGPVSEEVERIVYETLGIDQGK